MLVIGSPYQQHFLNSGVADPRDLGSCAMELVTGQLMVGNFQQPSPPPPPPRSAVHCEGNLKHPGHPWVPTGT